MRTQAIQLRSVAPAVAGVLGIAAVWHIVAVSVFTRDNGTYGAIPPPAAVVVRVVTNVSASAYWEGISATAGAAALGYVIGAAIALVLGVIALLVAPLRTLVSQVGVISACVPVAAISPIIVMMSPTGSRAVSVALATLAVLFPMIVGVLLALQSASATQLDVVRAYGGSRFTEITRVRLVAGVPALLSAMRIGVPAAFLGAMTGEFFAVGVDTGAGRLLISQQYVGDYVGMWAIALLATAVSAAGYGLVALLARVVAPWTQHLEGAGV